MQALNKADMSHVSGGNPFMSTLLTGIITGLTVFFAGTAYTEHKESERKREAQHKKDQELLVKWYNDNPQVGYYPYF